MDATELKSFAERYLHARQSAVKTHFDRGTTGLESEWNIVNADFRPLGHVGSGPDAVSFAAALRSEFIPKWFRPHNDLEVFLWISEWMTRPYYDAVGTVYESRVLQGVMHNGLSAAGLAYGTRLYAWPGNLLCPVEVDHDSVPAEWSLSKRRYLQRCVDLFGSSLATAGLHTNVSLPEPLLSLDFLHLSPERRVPNLVTYRNEQYIRGARVSRAFASLFMATAAASPFAAEFRDDELVVRITEHDSNRLLQFPNPPELDQVGLYRSHEDYVRISDDLVRRRVRFGNNNWTPTRARSDREYVDRIIQITSDQLHDTYRKGMYRVGEEETAEQLLQRIEVENLLARVDIPMSRVEIRSDEGGLDLQLDVANTVFRELMLMYIYADQDFGHEFAYDTDDLDRARRNEDAAAKDGLRARIEHPFTHRQITMREFLRWTLDQIEPLAVALDRREALEPLYEMANWGPNMAERLRHRVRDEIGEGDEVPIDLLKQLAVEHEQQLARDIEYIFDHVSDLGDEAPKLREALDQAGQAVRTNPAAPYKFEPPVRIPASMGMRDKTTEIVELAQALIKIPSVTNCPNERIDEVFRASRFIAGYLRESGLEVHLYSEGKYPSLMTWFPGRLTAPIMLSGHFDVVEPFPDDSQFEPVIEGDYLWGRGSADMKTVVATYMVWMRDIVKRNGCTPPINMMLVGNEENGEAEPTGTPHIFRRLMDKYNYEPELMIVGERTGEKGNELFGEICTQSRGLVRIALVGKGVQGHTGVGNIKEDLVETLIQARTAISVKLSDYLTLDAEDAWKTDYRYSFMNVGQTGVYNILADQGHLGLEIRPIPQDDLPALIEEIRAIAKNFSLEVSVQSCEPGIICDSDNPHLLKLIEAAGDTFGTKPAIGKKKPGTSGRFAPHGQAVVWGQTGIGPHSPSERHYIPSIKGYYDALMRFAELLQA